MPKFKPLPSQQELHRLFDYSVVTGELYWKKARNDRMRVGAVAGTKTQGYINIKMLEGQFRAHRLVWRWVTGEDPGALVIDHIDRNGQNNAWHNLRLATVQQNCTNTKATGVIKYHNRWVARIWHDGKPIYLGTHATEKQALEAYQKKKQELHGAFLSLG